jgi:hypothetical protein
MLQHATDNRTPGVGAQVAPKASATSDKPEGVVDPHLLGRSDIAAAADCAGASLWAVCSTSGAAVVSSESGCAASLLEVRVGGTLCPQSALMSTRKNRDRPRRTQGRSVPFAQVRAYVRRMTVRLRRARERSASTCEFVRLCAGQRGYDPLQSAQSPQEFQRYGRDRAVAEGQSLGLVLPVGTVSGVTLWRLRKDAAASVGLFDSRGLQVPR